MKATWHLLLILVKSKLHPTPYNLQPSKGFTLVELTLVMALFALLSGFALMNISRPQTDASLDASVQAVIADIKQQQLKAMTGESGDASTSQPHGIFFENNRYTLFQGATYDSGDSNNFQIALRPNVRISANTLPSATALFAKRSGELPGGPYTLTIVNDAGDEAVTLTVNRLGGITRN